MIVWGKRMRNIIDITNKSTKRTKRSVVLSFAIYVLVNCITLVAMVNTVDIKMQLVESSIIGIMMEVLDISVIDHSINRL